MDLFKSIVAKDKQNSLYQELANDDDYEPARCIIIDLLKKFNLNDGNFPRQFQLKQSFHHRLWELYLYTFICSKSDRKIINQHVSPDLHINDNGQDYFIEATTLNLPSEGINKEENLYLFKKYKSALIKKFNKRYWELEAVRGKPFIIAVHDYSLKESFGSTPFYLIDWLYLNKLKNKNEYLDIFDWDEWKNISGILVSGQATIPKFNRMGILAGFGTSNIMGMRLKNKLFTKSEEGQLTLDEDQPMEIKRLDDPSYKETWSEGIVFFHNPNAIHPILPPILGDITHVTTSKNRKITIHPTGDEFSKSETWFFKAVKEF